MKAKRKKEKRKKERKNPKMKEYNNVYASVFVGNN